MRVIEQARLWFREGTSDKVYEVDLVEVAPNQYVVNFRFGRRGTALRDGTKTATPVSLAKARTIFGKLVAEKTAGGYQPLGAPAAAPAGTPAPHAPRTAPDPAAAEIVARLRIGAREQPGLLPAVWNAAARDLTPAEPALRELLEASRPTKPRNVDASEGAWQHMLVSALVRCGTSASLPLLDKVATDPRTQPYVRDVAKLAVVRIAPDRVATLARPMLPAAMAAALDKRDVSGLARAAEEFLAVDPERARAAAVALYLINDEVTRPAVFAIARIARLSNAEAAIVRALFRLAELRRDGELYILVARRIDAYASHERPFGPRTRLYFRRRVARVLRRLARAGSPHYVEMATSVLLAYSDEDAEAPRVSTWNEDRYDAFARYHALNDILYGHSPRYARAHHFRSAWKCIGGYRPGTGTVPTSREERYPALWDAAPAALWRVLGAARATPVIEFAVKALRANRAYVDALPDEAIAGVLAGGHLLAQRFAFEVASRRPMSTVLARGALASDLPEAHAWVLRWIASHLDETARDPELIALLVTGKAPAIREAALSLLRGRSMAPEILRSAALRSIAILLGLPDTATERASASVNVVLDTAFEHALREISPDVLRDLIAHPLAPLGELAGNLMLRHAHRDSLPSELLEALLASPHASVRAYGGRLLAQLPPEIAKDDPTALVLFATSANAELRENTRSLLGEVARRYPDVGRVIANQLVDALLTAQPDGTPAHIVSLLRTELAHVMPVKPAGTIMKLIGMLSPHAREAGGLLLPQLRPDDIGLDDIIRLAHHEILAIRQGAWALARASLPRFKLAQVAVARLVDSPWEDTRTFATAFIRDELKTLSADAIIAICDSIRPEVQALGKQLLHEQFEAADAGRYLTRLAEHPSTNLQLLVSGLLEHHVGGDLERLRALASFLVTVLSQVNRGKVAKERVINLLRREAARSSEHARVIAPILDRQSATIAITQKHPLIATMVDVRTTFPEVPLPITIVPPEGEH